MADTQTAPDDMHVSFPLYAQGARQGFRPYRARRSTSRGTIRTPASDPSEPRREAASPNSSEESDETPGPVTTSGTGSSVWALRRHDVEWSAVTATRTSPGRLGTISPKEGRS